MRKLVLAITLIITSQSYADTYKGVYRCHSSGVDWESATECPPSATPAQQGINFSNYRMPDENKINPYRNGNRPSVFSIKERYKEYRQDLKFNNARTGNQDYLRAKLAELDRNERIELNSAR